MPHLNPLLERVLHDAGFELVELIYAKTKHIREPGMPQQKMTYSISLQDLQQAGARGLRPSPPGRAA